MINFLSTWVKNLSLALIIVSILEMILPNNKNKKYIKMVMGLYILFTIISPFVENSDKFNINNVDFFTEESKETSSDEIEVDQTSMDERLNEIYKEELEKDITQKIKQKGYEIERCKVVAHISKEDSGIESINIKIKSRINIENGDEEEKETIEGKLVNEIQKIQKVKVDDSNDEKKKDSVITKADISIIKKFLLSEYGVSEECLKIS